MQFRLLTSLTAPRDTPDAADLSSPTTATATGPRAGSKAPLSLSSMDTTDDSVHAGSTEHALDGREPAQDEDLGSAGSVAGPAADLLSAPADIAAGDHEQRVENETHVDDMDDSAAPESNETNQVSLLPHATQDATQDGTLGPVDLDSPTELSRPRLRIERYRDPNRPSSPHCFETVEAELDDFLVIKLGRPVKSKEEKERERQAQEQQQQNRDESGEDNSNEGENDAAASASAEAAATPSGSMTVAQGKNGRTIQYVWFKSKVVSRTHAEIWLKDGHLYIKDTASSSGTFLNRLRLSSSGKESRPYPLKDGDVVQLGIDYQGRPEDIFKSVLVKVHLLNKPAIERFRKRGNPHRFQQALRALLVSTNPYASAAAGAAAPDDNNKQTVDCCICLSALSPYQAMFISPCSHCYHYKCIQTLLEKGVMFQCPLCRQVANLNASVSVDSLDESAFDDAHGTLRAH